MTGQEQKDYNIVHLTETSFSLDFSNFQDPNMKLKTLVKLQHFHRILLL